MKLFLEPSVDVERRDDGSIVLRSPTPLGPYPRQFGEHLRRWAKEAPDRLFLAERQGESWRRLAYGEARRLADRLSAGLLALGLGPERPLMILSGNSVNQALLTLAAMQVGIPAAPISPAYSLMSADHGKLRAIRDLLAPGLIYVEQEKPFAAALASLEPDCEVVTAQSLERLLGAPGEEVEAAYAAVGPDAIAKILFTSGSTGLPKGVVNTQRMLCANQAQVAQCYPLCAALPPVLLDWLPWNHTYGGNHNLGLVLVNGGALWIDGGRPAPGLIDETVRNLREVSPTMYFNVPAGYNALLPFLERDEALRAKFFARLRLIVYAGAALPQDLWERLERVSLQATGGKVPMVSAWGSTETAPMATAVHWPIDRAGAIGLPAPGVELKLVPNGAKLELRVRGPNVMPGYWKRPDLTEAAFDDEGFYRIGDAGRFVDPADPVKGVAFDGRIAEDFKLATGTWVHVGALRVAALAACSPLLSDAVVCGHDRDYVALLAWPNRALGEAERTQLREALTRHNAANPSSSMQIVRILLLSEPPSADANEITDKGYVNQRAVLERRAADLARLYAHSPDPDVIAA